MLAKITNRLSKTIKVLLKGDVGLRRARPEIRPLTQEEVLEARSFFPRDKFFVYGAARSGTTLLMRLIDAHPGVLCTRQAHFFSREPYLDGLVRDPAVAEWLSRRSNRWNRGTDLSPVVMRAAADFILEREAAAQGAAIVGDKSPNSLNHGTAIDLTYRIYPDAKLIYIVRDGRDATLSHRFQAFIDGTAHLNKADWRIREAFGNDPESFRTPEKSLFTEKGIRSYAEKWVENIHTSTQRGEALYGDSFFSLRYEDLMADPVVMLDRIWAFLGAPAFENQAEAVMGVLNFNRDARWQESQAGTFADRIPKGRSGSWREFFSVRDIEIFERVAGDVLEQWGYRDG